jgi:hypothetical protein
VVRGGLLRAVVVAVLSGCSGERAALPAAPSATAAGTIDAGSPCPVTAPGGKVPEGFDYGSGGLAVALWPRGTLVAGRLADGSSYAEIEPDDSIRAKLGWWRGAAG